jgi:hypothetical protein
MWLDRIANRDFAYLLLILAIFNRLEWFLWIGAFGSVAFSVFLYTTFHLNGRLASSKRWAKVKDKELHEGARHYSGG